MLVLTGKNFELYAMQNYINSNCVDYMEFKDDLARVRYVRRLLNRYVASNELRYNILRNHIIVLVNVFSLDTTLTLLFSKVEPELHSILYTVLFSMYTLPERINNVTLTNINIHNGIIDAIRTNHE